MNRSPVPRPDRTRRSPLLVVGAVVATTISLVCSGCATSSSADVVRADVPRAEAAQADADPGVTATDALAADLFTSLANADANLVFSPYSIEEALAMARDGAAGETRAQMDAVLHAGAGDQLDAALNALDQQLASRAGHRGDAARNGDIALSTADALFGQAGTPFQQTFLEELSRYYGAGMRLVDFEGNTEDARHDINAWAEQQTNAKIVDLLPEGSLDTLTRLVLTNAVYFKAPWAKRFFPAGDKPFTTTGGTVVSAPAMSTDKIGSYREGVGWKAAEIPYLGGELSMIVVVPDDLASFDASIDGDALRAIGSGPAENLASLQMPKFTFRSTVQLKDQLSALGMPLAFDENRADFTGMTTTERLHIKDVFHQAFIAVDEEGTEAAAATAVVGDTTSAPAGQNVVVDRPFLFAIRDVASGAILFLGQVTDPTAT